MQRVGADSCIGNTNLIRDLLTEKPGLVNAVNQDGATPLILAATYGREYTVAVFLENVQPFVLRFLQYV
jgi:ankyrin repeat protein